jgi:hypothetical protein
MDEVNRRIGMEIEQDQGSTPWSAERRLEFIDFRLLWERTVNRSDLIDFFRISPQQASADLARYAALAPGNLTYDKSLKTYCASSDFKPIAARSDAASYLSELGRLSSGGIAPKGSFIGWRPDTDVVQYPSRPLMTETLMRLLWSMHDGEELLVLYQSLRRPSPTERWIAPHALASDGHRWHVRAWCHENRDFRDFVISRIHAILDRRKTTASFADDVSWHAQIEIVIVPRTGLTDGQRKAIEIDFGMSNGQLKLKCRKALAFYLLRQLQLERPADRPPAAQPLDLVNREELSDVFATAQKTNQSPSMVQTDL